MPDPYDPSFVEDVKWSIEHGRITQRPTEDELAYARRLMDKKVDELLSGVEPNGATGPATQGATLTLRTMAELRNLPASDASWVVERFLAEGAITELTAWIKTGKSTLLAQLLAAVLQDQPFLGLFTVDPGPVVLLTEERPSSLLAALEAVGVNDSDQLHIAMWFEQTGLAWEDAVAQAARFARERKAKVLAVDTLGRWAGVEDENNAAMADRAMAPLQRETQGFAAIILRQAGKSLRETQNAGRGSSAYGGAADIILSMQHSRSENGHLLEDDPKRWISVLSRYERDAIPRMELRYDGGRYLPLKTTDVVDATACNAVQRDLQRYGPSRPYDVIQRTGMNPATVRSALYRLRRRDELSVVEGLYQCPIAPDVAPLAVGGVAPPLGGVQTPTATPGLNSMNEGRNGGATLCRSDGKQPASCRRHLRMLDAAGRCPVSGEEVS